METRYGTVSRLLNDKEFLDEIGLSLDDVAKRSGVDKRWLYNIKKRDRKHPSSDMIDSVYQFLISFKAAA